MINVEIIKVHAGQILPCGQVTGNKEFTIGGLNVVHVYRSIVLGNMKSIVGKNFGKFPKAFWENFKHI